MRNETGTDMPDVLIAGGGVIGLSVAWELARQGVSVLVVDQSRPGQEASWAGAGMLPPGNPEHATPGESSLRALSCSVWPDWTNHLRETTGIDNGYRNSGGLQLSLTGDVRDELRFWGEEGVRARGVTGEDLLALESGLGSEFQSACFLPEMCQVRNPRHLKALIAACLASGVEFLDGTPVTGWDIEQGRVVAARTPGGHIQAGQFVITAGAWSKPLLENSGCSLPIEPVRGQIALLRTQPGLFTRILEIGSRYLVPRSDGRVIVGSTEERVGFTKGNTASGIQGLLQLATRVVPDLGDAELERCWAGLRPSLQDGLPVIGPVPETENLFVAAGHFRSGLQNSPGTGVLLSEMILGHEPSISMEPFLPANRTHRRSATTIS